MTTTTTLSSARLPAGTAEGGAASSIVEITARARANAIDGCLSNNEQVALVLAGECQVLKFLRQLDIAQPPLRTPSIDLKMHWYRSFQRDPKNRWLREIVASLFTGELDEWHL